jgi:hypothetical protein
MTQIPSTVSCPYPGFETFAITYDMMARAGAITRLQSTMGQAEDSRTEVVIDMTGWPEAEFPGGPFGDNAPMAVLLWTVRDGYAEAVAQFANNPLRRTRS